MNVVSFLINVDCYIHFIKKTRTVVTKYFLDMFCCQFYYLPPSVTNSREMKNLLSWWRSQTNGNSGWFFISLLLLIDSLKIHNLLFLFNLQNLISHVSFGSRILSFNVTVIFYLLFDHTHNRYRVKNISTLRRCLLFNMCLACISHRIATYLYILGLFFFAHAMLCFVV